MKTGLQSRYRTFILLTAVIVGTVIIVALLNATKDKVRSKPVEEKRWDVNHLTAQYGNYSPALQAFGQVHSPASAQLSANIPGTVQETPVLDGQYVAQGDLLISINPSEAKRIRDQRLADLNDAKAALDSQITKHSFDLKALTYEQELLALAKKSVTRIKQLKRQNLSAESDLEAALMTQTQQAIRVNQMEQAITNHPNQIKSLEARVSRSQALYEQAEEDVSNTQIKAPFDGRVTHLNIAVGDRINKGTPVISLYSTGQLELRVHLPAQTIDHVQGIVSPELVKNIYALVDVAGQTLKLPFNRVAGEVRSGSAGLEAVFNFPNEPQSSHTTLINLGKTLSAKVILPALQNVLAVPSSAIYQDKYIFRISDGELESVAIKRIGYWHNEQTPDQSYLIIQGNIKEGDTLLASLLPNAIDGLKVKIHD